jgi:hypothetical protein
MHILVDDKCVPHPSAGRRRKPSAAAARRELSRELVASRLATRARLLKASTLPHFPSTPRPQVLPVLSCTLPLDLELYIYTIPTPCNRPATSPDPGFTLEAATATTIAAHGQAHLP